MIPGACAAIGLLLAAVLRRRDRDANDFRPLLPLPPLGRALSYGALAGAAIYATWTMYPLLGAVAASLAILCATLRAPRPQLPTGSARWLAMPESALPAPRPRVLSMLDPGGARGRAAAAFATVSLVVAMIALRRDPRVVLALAMNATVLLPLFLTGRGAQIPPDRVADAWTKLARIMAALTGVPAG